MEGAGGGAGGVVVPELGGGVVVEGEGADGRRVVVRDVQLGAVDALGEVRQREADGPLVADAAVSHPVAGLVEQLRDRGKVVGARGADDELPWRAGRHQSPSTS